MISVMEFSDLHGEFKFDSQYNQIGFANGTVHIILSPEEAEIWCDSLKGALVRREIYLESQKEIKEEFQEFPVIKEGDE